MAERGRAGGWEHLAQWADGAIDLDRTLSTLPCSDRDAAELFDSCWPEQIFFEPGRGRQSGRWLLWDGRCQHPDTSRLIDRRIDRWTHLADIMFDRCHQRLELETAATMVNQPQAAIDAQVEIAWQVWTASKAWAYARKLRDTTQAAKLRERLAGMVGTDTTTWPHHPDLLNVADKVVSLNPSLTGWETHEHHPWFRMTYCVEVPWQPVDDQNPLAACPWFASLLLRACGNDTDVAWYLLHALGYALLGDNRYQRIFFLRGDPACGKSTLLEIVSTVLGELAHTAMPELVTKSPRGDARHGRHNASIRGKRFVTLDETDDTLRLDENQVKTLTGQKRQTVDVIYKEELTGTLISALLFVGNNRMPEIGHLDGALQRRITVCPMGSTIPEAERIDRLADKIAEAEGPAILALLVWACRRVVVSDGRIITMPPAAVVAKTGEYVAQQHTIALWAADRCWPANGQANVRAETGANLMRDYRAWCSDNDRITVGPSAFYDDLPRQVQGVTRTNGVDQIYFHGLILKNPGMA